MAKVLATVVFNSTPNSVIPERNRPQSKKAESSITPARVRYYTCEDTEVSALQKKFPSATVYTQAPAVNATPVSPAPPAPATPAVPAPPAPASPAVPA